MFTGLLARDTAFDLGTANTVAFVEGRGIVLSEASVVALDEHTDEILAVGSAAKSMMGRAPENVVTLRPLNDGAISDFETTRKMLSYFIHKAQPKRLGFWPLLGPRVVVCVPSGITEIELRAVKDAVRSAGARRVYTIEEPLASAIGAGLPVDEAKGSMVVNIGGGTSEVAVVSLGGIVAKSSTRVAGDDMDYALSWYLQNEYDVFAGIQTGEQLKMTLGSALPLRREEAAEVKGRDLHTGVPKTTVVTSEEVRRAISIHVAAIAAVVRDTLKRTPPELVSDIMNQGIVLTGGGALLRLLDERLRRETGVPVYVADDPLMCAVVGSARCLKQPEYYPNALASD